MAILSDHTLHDMLDELVLPADHELVNPASVDVRIGKNALIENEDGLLVPWDFENQGPMYISAGGFLLVETYEKVIVPNWLAVELKLKSSMARMGWNHSLAFWIDPGWNGILTMEIINQRKIPLNLVYGQRFAQMIFHELNRPATPYNGRYQGAGGVENAK